MKKYFILTACITAFLFSCQSKNPLIFETREVDFINKTSDVVEGDFLELEVMGATSIAVYDTLLMVVTNNPNALLQVYNTKTLEPLAMLCQQGHAKNEFAESYLYKLSDQVFMRNGDVIIVLRGEGGYVLKEINVTASIREGKTVVEGINTKVPYGCQEVYGIDNELTSLFTYNNHNYNLDMEEYNPPTFSVINENGAKEIKIFRSLVDFENPEYTAFWYNNGMSKHPTKNIFVQCVTTMDYIHFLDLDNENYFSIHQVGAMTYADVSIPYVIKDKIYYEYDYEHFHETIVAEDYLLVFYLNGDYRKQSVKEGNNSAAELLAFDWNGNYLGGVKIDLVAQDFAYDSKNKILYGYRIFDEKIIAYDLSEFVNSFAK